MIYEDLKPGVTFTIGETPSYPKYKLRGDAYVDMRDEILNKDGATVKGREVRLLTVEEMAKQFNEPVDAMKDWIKEIFDKFWERVS